MTHLNRKILKIVGFFASQNAGSKKRLAVGQLFFVYATWCNLLAKWVLECPGAFSEVFSRDFFEGYIWSGVVMNSLNLGMQSALKFLLKYYGFHSPIQKLLRPRLERKHSRAVLPLVLLFGPSRSKEIQNLYSWVKSVLYFVFCRSLAHESSCIFMSKSRKFGGMRIVCQSLSYMFAFSF